MKLDSGFRRNDDWWNGRDLLFVTPAQAGVQLESLIEEAGFRLSPE